MGIRITIDTIVRDLQLQKQSKTKQNNWNKNSTFITLRKMDNDTTGDIGELLLEKVFMDHGYNVVYERSKTSKEKNWDIEINDKKIEVKTATLGSTGNTFQHEKFFASREYDIIAFIDITPDNLYCCFGLRENIVWENLHERKVNGQPTNEFKFDFGLNSYKKKEIRNKEGEEKLKNPKMAKIETDKDLIKLFEEVLQLN